MVGEWIVDVISFQKIFGLCCLKCHIVEIWRDVTFEDNGRTDGRTDDGNVNIELESAKQDLQFIIVFCDDGNQQNLQFCLYFTHI